MADVRAVEPSNAASGNMGHSHHDIMAKACKVKWAKGLSVTWEQAIDAAIKEVGSETHTEHNA